jgi:hypothetical protein
MRHSIEADAAAIISTEQGFITGIDISNNNNFFVLSCYYYVSH